MTHGYSSVTAASSLFKVASISTAMLLVTILANAQPAAIVNGSFPRHETSSQNQIEVRFDQNLGGTTNADQWAVSVNGTAVNVYAANRVGSSSVLISFDASNANSAAVNAETPDVDLVTYGVQRPLLPGQTLEVSFQNIEGTLTNVTGTQQAQNFALAPSKNNFARNCTEVDFVSQGSFSQGVCAPVTVNGYQYIYAFSLRLRNSSNFVPGPLLGNPPTVGAFGASLRYGDPENTDRAYFPFRSDNAGNASGSVLELRDNAPVLYYTFRPNDFTYPGNTGICVFTANFRPAFFGEAFCNGESENTSFRSYQTDQNGLNISPTIDGANRVCRGSDVEVTYSDKTFLNCAGPPIPASAGTLPNQEVRYIRFVYGSQDAGAVGNIPNIRVERPASMNGFPEVPAFIDITNATGTLADGGGLFFAGNGGEERPDENGVIELPIPVTAATAATYIGRIISTSAAGQVDGQRLYVRIDYWNTCNPYNQFEPDANRVSLSDYIEIIAKPDPPTAALAPLCETANNASFNITATGTGSGTLTYTWYLNADKTGVLQARSTDADFNPVTEGPVANRINKSVTGSQEFKRYVTVTQGSNNCESDPLEITIRIDDTNLAGMILGASPQTICSGTDPVAFTSTTGIGGGPGGTITYQWQSSPDNTAWTNIAGATGATYDPGTITTRTYFRRRLRSGQCADVFSNVIEFRVDTPVNGGTIAAVQTICEGGDPTVLTNTASPTGGNTTYSYQWESALAAGGPFTTIAGATSATYDPPAGLLATTFYRRRVTSGVCTTDGDGNGLADNVAYSNEIQVTVEPPITAGTIGSSQTICSGDTPLQLTGGLPAGGSGTYTYLWEQSTTSATTDFSNALGTNNTQSYQPQALTQTTWFRRRVTAGACPPVTSTAVQVTVNPLPAAANPTGGGSVCLGAPAPDIVWNLTGTPPFNFTIARSFEGPLVVTNHPTYQYIITAPAPAATQTYQITALTDATGCNAVAMGTAATVNVTDTPPPTVDSFTGGASVCDDGAVTTNPPDAVLDLAPNSVQTYSLTYRLYNLDTGMEGALIGPANFTTNVNGELTISPTYAQMGGAANAAGYQVIVTQLINTATACAGVVPIGGPTLVINPRPAAPTNPVNGTSCNTGTAATLAVTPQPGTQVVWYSDMAGTTLAAGTVSGADDRQFTPTANANATFYAFSRVVASGCQSTTGVVVQHTVDVGAGTANAGPDQTLCALTTGLQSANLGATAPSGGLVGTWTIPGHIAYFQNFANFADGQTFSTAYNGWTLDLSGPRANPSYFEVRGGRFETRDTNGGLGGGAGNIGEVVWLSQVFDISAASGFGALTASVDVINASNNLDNAEDYIKVYYKVDGGGEVQFPTNGNNESNFASATASAPGLTGNTLQIVIRISANAGDEIIAFDNIVVRNPASTITFNSNANAPDAAIVNIPSPAAGAATGITTTFLWTVASASGTCPFALDDAVITVNPLPLTNNAVDTFCEATFGGGIVNNVDLGAYSATVTGIGVAADYTFVAPNIYQGQGVAADRRIIWFTNMARTAPVGNASSVDNVTNGLILYARVQIISTGCFVNSGQVTFIVNPLPVAQVVNRTFCPVTPSLTSRTITLATDIPVADIIGTAALPADRTVSFHNNLTDAQGNTGAITTVNLTGAVTLVARVQNNISGCFNTADINLNLQLSPVNNILSDASGNDLVDQTDTPLAAPAFGFEDDVTICASSSLVLYQIDPTTNPGATYSWNIPAPSYAGEFEILTPALNSFFVILRFPNSTAASPLYSAGIPISVTESIGGCPGNTLRLNVQVEGSPPQPVIAGPAAVCENGTEDYTITTGEGTTHSWSIPPGASIIGPATGASITVRFGTFDGNVSVVAQSGNSCTSTPSTSINVDVVPRPSFTYVVNSNLCSGGNVSSVVSLTASIAAPLNPADVRYNWEVISSNVSGAFVGDFANGVSTISQVLTNTTGIPGTVIYRVTPVGAAPTSCSGVAQNITITVDPAPQLNLNNVTICSGAPANYEIKLAPLNLPSATTFSWAAPTMSDGSTQGSAGVNVAAGAPGTIHINTTFTNTTGSPITATYQISATSGSCVSNQSAAARTFQITINPEPVGVNTAVGAICSGSGFTPIDPQTNNVDVAAGGNGVVSSFTWTATYNGATGGAGSGSIPVGGTLPSETLVNITGSAVNVVYTLYPKSQAGSCTGAPARSFTITIPVNPEPVGVNTAQQICSGNSFSINPQTNNMNVSGGNSVLSSFAWTASYGAVTGGAGSGNVAVNGNLSETLRNVTGLPVNVVYTIFPTSQTGSCTGTPARSFTHTVTVNPEPVGVNTVLPAICSGVGFSPINPQTNNINVSGGNSVLSSFTWTASYGGVTGGVGSGTIPVGGTLPSEILINRTNATVNVVYTLFPVSQGKNCPGVPAQSFTITIPVNPEPVGINTIQTICSGVIFSRNLQTLNIDASGGNSVPSTFTWSATYGAVTGGAGSGTIAAGGSLSETLRNITSAPIIVVYTVNPTSITGSCTGSPAQSFTHTVTVNPEPIGINTLQPAICSGAGFTPINPQANNLNVAGGNGVVSSFSWTASYGAVTGGAGTGNIVPGGPLPSEPLVNTTSATINVVYTLSPTAVLGSCTGVPANSFTITIPVRPEPVGVSTSQTICSNASFSLNPQTANLNAAGGNGVPSTFTWTAVYGLVTGGSGTGSIAAGGTLSETLRNVTSAAINVVYTVTPSAVDGSCAGAIFTHTVTVNPEPVASSGTIDRCSGASVNFDLQTLVTNGLASKFRYTASVKTGDGNPIDLSPALFPGSIDRLVASNASITDQFTNNSGGDIIITYEITPVSDTDNCEGASFTLKVRYRTEPRGANFAEPICSSAVNHNIQTQIANGVASNFFYTVSSSDPVNVPAGPDRPVGSASNSPITDSYVNATSTPVIITYQITAISIASGCQAQTSFLYAVTIDSKPVASASIITKGNVCSDEPFSFNPQNDINAAPGNGVNSTFQWTVSYNGGPPSGINSGTITASFNNISTSTRNAVYTVTPTSLTGCVGDAFEIVVPVLPEPVMLPSLATPATLCSTNSVSANPLAIVLGTTASSATPSGYNVLLKSIDAGLTAVGSSPTTVGSIGNNLAANVISTYAYRNVTATQLRVVFTVTPITAAGCLGDPIDIIAQINPEPVLAAPAVSEVCSTNANVSDPINLVLGTNGSSVNAANYTLLNLEYGVGEVFSATPPAGVVRTAVLGTGINLIRNDFYANTAANPVTIRYNVRGTSASGCISNPLDYDVVINPQPELTPSAVSVCSGEGIGASIGLSPAVTSAAISSYDYKQLALSDARLTAAVGNAALGIYPAAAPPTTFLSSDVFFNVGDVNLVATYTLVPITAKGCKGLDQSVDLTVRPAPAVVAGFDVKVCNDVASGIVLRDNSATNPDATPPYSIAASEYEITGVTFNNAVLNATGGAPGTSGRSPNVNILSDDQFTNLTNNPQTVSYKVVPFSASNCRGPERTITLTVEPPITAVGTNNNPLICSGTPTAIVMSSPSNPTPIATPPLITYNYNMIPVEGGGISGNTSGSNVAAGTIADNLVNATNSPITVTYRITALAASSADGKGCTSPTTNIMVTVEPKPKLTPTRFVQTVCEGTPITNVTLNTTTTTPSAGSLQFLLNSVIDPFTGTGSTVVSGNTALGTVYTPGQPLNDVLANSTAQQQTIRYTYTPSFTGGLLCVGDPVNIDITVTPRPQVTVVPGSLTLCSGDTFQSQMTTDTDLGSTIVTWTASAVSPDVIGESNGAGNELFQTLLNRSNAPQTVDYLFTSSFNGCTGNTVPLTVTINPTPVLTPPSRQLVCAGTPFSLDLTSVTSTNAAQTTFQWVVTDINGIGNPGQYDGSGTLINESYINNTNSQATLIYQITPFGPGGCPGIDKILNVAVAPTISGAFLSPDEQLCEGTPVFLIFDLQGQAPLDFVYRATDANGTVTTNSVTRSGNIKVERVTPSTTTVYEIVSIKDGLGCTKSLTPQPAVTITVFKSIDANWVANIPDFVGGSAAVGFTNTSVPLDEGVFRYEWTFGTDAAPNPASATGAGPFTVSYSRPGDHFVSLRAVNTQAEAIGQSCEDTYSARISIPVLPLSAAFDYEPKAACFPQNIVVTENTATGDVMEWTVIDSNGKVAAVSNAPFPEFLIASPGTYTISLKTSNSFTGQAALADDADFTIHGNPVASFDVRPLLVYVPDTELTTFNFSSGATEYLWDFGDGGSSTEFEPRYVYQIEGLYDITLVAINDHGDGAICRDTLVRQITARQGGITRVPNAFTPNLNGPTGGVAGNNTFNDVFLPLVRGAEEFNMQVFDRWGNLVFESNNSNVGWDGYDQNGRLMPAGVYVYKLTVKLSDGQRSTQVGDITMIR